MLDNHDDFGGHAKRNEFTVDGRLLIGYGGSQSIDSPQTRWSAAAKGLLRDLGVDVTRFETAFEQRLYASLGLSRGLFLPREHFGRDVLVAGDPLTVAGNAQTRALSNARPLAEFVADLPICGGEPVASSSRCSTQRATRSRAAALTRSSSFSNARAIATI